MNNDEIYLRYDSSSAYLESVDAILAQLESDSSRSKEYIYPFLLVAGSSLESTLNRAIIWWALDTFSISDGERLANGFCTITLKGKLDTFAYLITNGQYNINTGSKKYQALSHLITVRNQVAHHKAWPIKHDGEVTENTDGSLTLKASKSLQRKLQAHPRNMTIKDFFAFRNALFDLSDAVDRFTTNHEIDAELFQKCNLTNQ